MVADQIAGEAPVQRSGQQVYKEICAACHGPDGAGLARTFPPLKGSEWIEDPELIAQIVLRGLAGKLYVQGVRYASAMSLFGKTSSQMLSLLEWSAMCNKALPKVRWEFQKVA